MKKVIRKGILMLGLFTTIASYANEVSYTSIISNNTKTTLILNQLKKGHRIIIKDARGMVLYKEYIKDSGAYSKEFDLTQLPNGNYLFEIEKDIEIKTIPFKVDSSTVSFKKDEETIIYKPVVFKRGDLVYISRYSFTEKPLEFKIYYADNPDYLIKESIVNEKYAGKIFNFSKARKGNYKIVFKTEGRIFTQNVKV